MNTAGTVRRVFPGGNTSRGFFSFYEYILPQEEAVRIFIVKGGPGVGKSTFMKKIADDLMNRGYDIEYEQCSSDNDSLDGILIPALKIALIDGTAPHVVDPKNPGVVDEIINLGEYWNETKIWSYRDEVLEVNKRAGKQYKIGYSHLKEASVAYDEWKSYVHESMDWSKYNETLRLLLDSVFQEAAAVYHVKPKERHLFASAITPGGMKNYIDTLIKPGMRVYTLEGEPGSGVKEMIGRTARTAWEMGLFTEQFHCPFEPDLLDMVIIPGINTVVLNTSKPFHFDIDSAPGLNIIKKFSVNTCINTRVLDAYKDDLEYARNRFHSLMESAVSHIFRAKSIHDTLEQYYVSSMDFKKIDEKQRETLGRILKYADGCI